jgi:hypothetical protein
MKITALAMFGAVAALTAGFATSFAQMSPGNIEVTQVTGEVNWGTEDEVSTKLKRGTVLRAGAKIETGNKGRAHLWFANGTHLVVLENTEVSILRFDIESNGKTRKSEFYKLSVFEEPSNSNTLIRLPYGKLRVEVAKLNIPVSSFHIRVPFVDVDVKGTDFKVEQNAEFARVSTYRGSVWATPDLSLDNNWGKAVELKENKSVVYRLRMQPMFENLLPEAGSTGAGRNEIEEARFDVPDDPNEDGPTPILPSQIINMDPAGPLDPTLIDTEEVTSKTNGEGKTQKKQ